MGLTVFEHAKNADLSFKFVIKHNLDREKTRIILLYLIEKLSNDGYSIHAFISPVIRSPTRIIL